MQGAAYDNKELILNKFTYLIVFNLGAVGFLSAFFFVEKIYGSVKVDWYSSTKAIRCAMQKDVVFLEFQNIFCNQKSLFYQNNESGMWSNGSEVDFKTML